MAMRSVALFALAVLAVTCGPSPDAKLPEFPGVKAGSAAGGSGGGSGGGVGGSGGAANTGGSKAPGTGGAGPGTGGRISGSGGRSQTPDAGADIRRDSGRGTGGGGGLTTILSDASRGGTGGGRDAGRDVFVARDVAVSESGGMVRGTGGGVGGRDAPTAQSDAPAGCMGQVVANDYACGAAAPCSECKANGESKEAECMKGVDCLASAGPSCDSNCQLACLNSAGDAVVQSCIKALQTAACSGSGC